MGSSVPHHHETIDKKNTRRRSSMGNAASHHHHHETGGKKSTRRSSMDTSASHHHHHHHETVDNKSTRGSKRSNRMEESVSKHDSSINLQTENDKHIKTSPADNWKPRIPLRATGVAVDILKRDSQRFPLSDERTIIGKDCVKSMVGDLSQSQSSQATKSTAASTLESGSSIGLPDLKPMTSRLDLKKPKGENAGSSNMGRSIANIEW